MFKTNITPLVLNARQDMEYQDVRFNTIDALNHSKDLDKFIEDQCIELKDGIRRNGFPDEVIFQGIAATFLAVGIYIGTKFDIK